MGTLDLASTLKHKSSSWPGGPESILGWMRSAGVTPLRRGVYLLPVPVWWPSEKLALGKLPMSGDTVPLMPVLSSAARRS